MKTKMSDWKEMYADVNWSDYGGKWAYPCPRKALAWYVLDFTNMDDACGRDNEGQDTYLCEVNYVDLTKVSQSQLQSAVESCGPSREDFEDMAVPDRCFVSMIAVHDYGIKAPLYTASGNRASWVRAEARRYAESLMSDDELLSERMDKPVNKIGSTAADFLRGDIDAGLRRAAEEVASGAREPTAEERVLMRIHATCKGQTLGGVTAESTALSAVCTQAIERRVKVEP